MTNYLSTAELLTPQLRSRIHFPRSIVETCPDSSAFQGWSITAISPAAELPNLTFSRNSQVILDFGEHLVGHVEIEIDNPKPSTDAPTRLKLIFAEVPTELTEPFEPYTGDLSRAWLQDESFTLDLLPDTLRPPRRYAFRYLKIQVVDTISGGQIKIKKVTATALTSADEAAVPPLPKNLPGDVHDLDTVSLRTLKNCMHTVFEDGPKRDRRLWLGDLRLQALANYQTFRNYDLVKRCLYLFAGCPRDDGIIPADVYWTTAAGTPRRGGCFLIDYSALFASTVLEYAQASNDWSAAEELWPVVKNQLQIFSAINPDTHIFEQPKIGTSFIDWRDGLHKQAAMHAVFIISARATLTLAQKLNKQNEIPHLPALLEKMQAAALRHFFDPAQNLFISPGRGATGAQISWATQAWMTLAAVIPPQQAAPILQSVMANPAAIRPAGPYLTHYFAEALFAANLPAQAAALIRQYWGGMLKHPAAASTFWEIFDPQNDKLSPYQNHLINSYCHAWSCTPTWFIRTHPDAFR